MSMDGSGLSVADALALQKDGFDNDGAFGGNNVHADQIRSRRVYHTNVATDVGVFTVQECELCNTGFNFPVLPATV